MRHASLNDLVNWGQVALSSVTALVAIWIAYHQLATARYRLNLDLYEKRYRVFEATRLLAGAAIRSGAVSEEELAAFSVSIAESKFLFDSDVCEHLDEFSRNAVALHEKTVLLRDTTQTSESLEHIRRQGDLVKWFFSQLDTSPRVFGPYLDFRKVKH
jgi:hypothetical protein